MNVSVRPLSPKLGAGIPLPFYASAGAAAMDLCACIDTPAEIPPGGWTLLPTGLALALPSDDCAGLIFARSGLGIRRGIALSDGVEILGRSCWRELQVGLINSSREAYTIQPGDRIAQLALIPTVQAELELADPLDSGAQPLI